MMQNLPFINACLNTVTFTLLVLAFIFIKRGNRQGHAVCMRCAFVVSSIFLASYLTYHFTQPSTKFLKEGWIRPVYFTILLSHTILAVVVLPLIFKAFYHALKQDWEKHKRVVRWAWPIWTYVAFTGPVIYLMLYKM